MLPSLLVTALFSALSPAVTPLLEEDWPEFGGPHRNDIVGPIESDFDWGAEGPAVAWRVEIGRGYGGTAVQDGQVFLLDREVGERDVMRVFSLESGEELWSAGYAAPGRLNFAGSRTVPSVQGDLVVTAGGFGHIAVFDRTTEELDWIVSLEDEYGGIPPMFGWSSAPLVLDGLVIAVAQSEEVGLVAFELETGAELWKTAAVGHSHSTPTVLTLLGEPQLLLLSTTDRASGNDSAAPSVLTSFDPDSGAQLWRKELLFSRLPIPGPVAIDDNRFFMTGGYKAGSVLLRIQEREGEVELEELFRSPRGAQIHRPLLKDGHLYVLANENWNYNRRQEEGGLMCLSLEGKELWRTKADPYFGRGHAILAGDHLLIQDGFDGTLRVVKASPESYQQVAEAKVFEGESRDGEMWAPMALAGKRLLMRSQDELVCVEL